VIKQDEELDKLEEDIRKLKNKYDQFFTGIIKVPPSFERHQVENYIHELGKQKMRDNTRRFRFNTILSRYNQYRELWGRRMREREEGPLDYRRRQAAMTATPRDTPSHGTPPVHGTSPPSDPYVKMIRGANGDGIELLYSQILREHEKLGKPANLSLRQLAAMIQKQSEMVREKYHVSTVAFRVETIDGKVRLKAKPLQD
jgi:hypothetical protein